MPFVFIIVFLSSVAFFSRDMLMFDSDPLFPSCPACITFSTPGRGWVVFPIVHMCA